MKYKYLRRSHMDGDDIKSISELLAANGWVFDDESDVDDYANWYKDNAAGVSIGIDEVVFFDDTGDFAHIPLNVYAVIGFMYAKLRISPVIPDCI